MSLAKARLEGPLPCVLRDAAFGFAQRLLRMSGQVLRDRRRRWRTWVWLSSRCCWTGSRTSRPTRCSLSSSSATRTRRETKIDVGVGVYRDAAGTTPILRCVKAAERILLETQETKAYLGSAGDIRFVELIKPIVFGDAARMTAASSASRRRAAAARCGSAPSWSMPRTGAPASSSASRPGSITAR
jgi:hypothetical protein